MNAKCSECGADLPLWATLGAKNLLCLTCALSPDLPSIASAKEGQPSTIHDLCDWPGCINLAICCTGNAGNAFVCGTHFHITNGPPSHNESERVQVLTAMESMAHIAHVRQELKP